MDNIRQFIDDIVSRGAYRIILSGANGGEYKKITLTMADGVYFAEKLTQKQAFHERIQKEAAVSRIFELFTTFSQINAWDREFEYTARITKKGKLLSGKHPVSSAPKQSGAEHKKSYLLPEGTVVPPLVDMGVMTADGRIIKSMYDKFRQINRFLEFIDELIEKDDMAGERDFNIIDFGCGKSYLTFIVYYYFTEIKHRRVRMAGVDLKKDVIEFCSRLAEKYGYSELKFYCGDIADYVAGGDMPSLDLVITLHACDTATDFALHNAVRFGAKYILSSPCCQHELNTNGDFSAFPLFNDGGILRERAAALMTDSIRQKLLTACSYSARVMEFVELSHTPKNLMIRAKKAALPMKNRRTALAEAEGALESLKTEQTLHRLLENAGCFETLRKQN